MNEKAYRVAFLILLLGVISALFVAMIRQFLITILLAAIFSGLAHPLYSKFTHWFRGRRGLASVVTLLVILVVVVGPLIFFLGVLASQAYQIAQAVGPWIQERVNEPDSFDQVLERFPALEKLRPYRTQVITKLGQAVGVVGNFLVNGLSATTRGTVTFFFHFSLMLYAMFFFLMDGRSILNKILSYIPLSRQDKDRLVDKFLSVSRATLKGTLVIGLVQGVLAGLAFAVAGIQGAVFWGTVMTVLSIIPGIGAAIVWVPAVVYLLATGHVLNGILLAIWCGVVVGTADNFLRPRLVGRDIKMHELLILFGTLGGVFLFGVVGFIIGPVLAALFVTIWEIYGEVFQEALPKRKTPSKDAGTGSNL